MRLGVLELGSVHLSVQPLLNSLRAQDIDVVVGEGVVTSLGEALSKARRLFRADCDGVLLIVGDGTLLETVSAAATLLAGVPLLLASYGCSSAFFDAVGALEFIGARFDRVYLANDMPGPDAYVKSWLRENAKKERQRGLEAARKLYGQSLYAPLETGGLPDAALWMHQFGIIPTTEAEGADFAAPTGDACGALTDHLLSLIADVPANAPISLVTFQGSEAAENDRKVTLARITRTKGRFRCLLLHGALRENGTSTARLDCADAPLFAVAASPLLHVVPGDHLGAMRAACESLGIDTVLLRPV